MKNPFVKDDRYEKLKAKIENVIKQYEELYDKSNPCFDMTRWVCADLQDAINEIESENK